MGLFTLYVIIIDVSILFALAILDVFWQLYHVGAGQWDAKQNVY